MENVSGVKKESGQLNKIHNRLITFGCSYTYGIGLPDCWKDPCNQSKMGWPNLVSDKLNVELINISASGASNFEILHNIINFDFLDSDIVVIMWTHYARDILFKSWIKTDPLVRLGPWTTGVGSWFRQLIDTHVAVGKDWIENMNEETFALKSWAYIHHADLYLKSKNIRYIHFPAAPNELLTYPVNYKIDNLHLCGIVRIDLGRDKLHPGVESNKHTADLIYKKLNEK